MSHVVHISAWVGCRVFASH